MTFALLVQSAVVGVSLASIYILMALGLTLMFGMMHIINFAHGAVYMLGAFVIYYVFFQGGMPYLAAFVAAVKKAQSLDPKKIAEALHTVEFDNLWGKAHFGGKDYYGVANQIIYSMPFSEVKDGVATLVAQLTPPYT